MLTFTSRVSIAKSRKSRHAETEDPKQVHQTILLDALKFLSILKYVINPNAIKGTWGSQKLFLKSKNMGDI